MSPVNEEQKRGKLKSWLPEKWDYEADVVVVGCGGAGVCAAIVAHDAGVQALILEKAAFGGGNTASTGAFMTIPTDVSKAIEYYRALSGGTADEELTRALAKAMFELPHRLEAWGGELKYLSKEPQFPTLPGSEAFRQRVHMPRTARPKEEQKKWEVERAPTAYTGELFSFLDKQAKKREIRVMYETPAKELIQHPVTKEILGVKAESLNGEIYVKARRGVVLACGGFQNNKEMIETFLPYTTQLPVYPWGTPYSTGDGILMASAVGAKLWHMSGCEWGQFAVKAPSEKFGVAFRLLRQLSVGSQAININKYGKRFMDESISLGHRKGLFTVQHFAHERAEYPNIPFYMVFDETFRKKRPIVVIGSGYWSAHKLYKWSDDNSAEIEQGWIVKADTIKELAGKIGVEPGALEETVSKYNKYCTIGEDSEFGRPPKWLVPIETPPYYAAELCLAITNTQGGPKHNALAQVLDKNDKPIPRLYAAGELGSFFVPLYEGASNVPEALAFGCIAGEHAAALTPWE